MQHDALRNVTPLQSATDWELEQAVDLIMAESELAGDYGYDGERASRAEALAIIGHELRRRSEQAPASTQKGE